MSYVKGLSCRECGREYPADPKNVCDFCFGPLEVNYDYSAIAKVISRKRIQDGPYTMWRYEDLLPVDAKSAIDIGCGFTPLIKANNLGKAVGLSELYIKNDAVNPTYSFKDRVVTVAITKAREFGFTTLACASTGNLAGSVAAHAAKAGMKAVIFMPGDLERGKMLGAAVYGPKVIAVNGSYDDVNRLCSELADKYSWAFVNINMRPYYSEGSKTLGYEVAEQLGWRAPAHCVVPVASGSLFTKIWKGLNEFSSLGIIGSIDTKMHVSQAAGCAPIADAWADGRTHVRPVKPNTVAKSLAIGNPADGFYAIKVVKESNGSACAVDDKAIIEGVQLLAETEGVFTETAGGVVVASLRQLAKSGVIKPDELTVAFITGNGLKTQEIVEPIFNPLRVDPTVEAFERSLNIN